MQLKGRYLILFQKWNLVTSTFQTRQHCMFDINLLHTSYYNIIIQVCISFETTIFKQTHILGACLVLEHFTVLKQSHTLSTCQVLEHVVFFLTCLTFESMVSADFLSIFREYTRYFIKILINKNIIKFVFYVSHTNIQILKTFQKN